jgi:GntR family transcriptional regulator
LKQKDLPIQLDFRSGQPLTVQIVEQVRQMVARGELHQGDQLPTVRQLATELRINFNTVARAYRILDELRLISTQRGRGTYIWEEPSEETVNALREEQLDLLAKQFVQGALDLGFQPDQVQAIVEKQLAQAAEVAEEEFSAPEAGSKEM